MNGYKKTVYLVGQISPLYIMTYEWRRYVRNFFGEDNTFNWIDPCSNNFNKKVLNKGKYAVTKEKRSWGIDILPHKDYSFVLESDIAIANMNQYDPDKPLLGSFFELAWYFIHPEKTVIGFADDLGSYICQHPFVQQAVSVWVNSIEDTCYLLEKYFVDAEVV